MNDLCNLGDVKSWLSIPTTQVSEDDQLRRLVTAISAEFLQEIDRTDFTPAADYTDVHRLGPHHFRSGSSGGAYGGTRESRPRVVVIGLRHWPINTIATVTVDGTAISPSADGIAAGWFVDMSEDPEYRNTLKLIDVSACPGRSVISVAYNAGYANVAVVNELGNIPALTPFTIEIASSKDFLSDTSVVFVVGGATLTKVSANPAASQYSVSDLGIYTFAAADVNKAVRISYLKFGIPADARQAVTEWVSFRYRSKAWIGQTSKHLSTGDTINVQTARMPESVAAIVKRYARPVAIL